MTDRSPPSPPDGPMPMARRSVWWWLVVGLLVAWVLAPLLMPSESRADLTYSRFIEEVEAGNVERVKIKGDEITGDFREAIDWPPPAADVEPDSFE